MKMPDELEMTLIPPEADPELTKAADFAILKASELLYHFGIVITELRINCVSPHKLLHTYTHFNDEESATRQ